MPTVREMFPSKYLSYSDFVPGELVQVTIKAFTLEAAAIRPGAYGMQSSQAVAEASWLIWFHEFAKPMKGRPGRVSKMLSSLNVTRTEDAIGKRVCIYRGFATIGDKQVEGLLVDDRPQNQLPAGGGRQAIADPYVATGTPGVIPIANMDRALATIRASGKSWDHFLGWLKTRSAEAFVLAHGQALDSLPAALHPAIKRYLDEITAPAPAQLPDAMASNAPAPPTIGQPGHPSYQDLGGPSRSVRNVLGSPAQAPATPPQQHDIDENDIPF